MIEIRTGRIRRLRRVAHGTATLALAALVLLGAGMDAAALHDHDDWDRKHHPTAPLLGGPGPVFPIAGGPPPFLDVDWDNAAPRDWD